MCIRDSPISAPIAFQSGSTIFFRMDSVQYGLHPFFISKSDSNNVTNQHESFQPLSNDGQGIHVGTWDVVDVFSPKVWIQCSYHPNMGSIYNNGSNGIPIVPASSSNTEEQQQKELPVEEPVE